MVDAVGFDWIIIYALWKVFLQRSRVRVYYTHVYTLCASGKFLNRTNYMYIFVKRVL